MKSPRSENLVCAADICKSSSQSSVLQKIWPIYNISPLNIAFMHWACRSATQRTLSLRTSFKWDYGPIVFRLCQNSPSSQEEKPTFGQMWIPAHRPCSRKYFSSNLMTWSCFGTLGLNKKPRTWFVLPSSANFELDPWPILPKAVRSMPDWFSAPSKRNTLKHGKNPILQLALPSKTSPNDPRAEFSSEWKFVYPI